MGTALQALASTLHKRVSYMASPPAFPLSFSLQCPVTPDRDSEECDAGYRCAVRAACLRRPCTCALLVSSSLVCGGPYSVSAQFSGGHGRLKGPLALTGAPTAV